MDQVDVLVKQATAFAEGCAPSGRTSIPVSDVIGGLIAVFTLWRAVMPSLDEALANIPHHTIFSPVAYCPVPFLWNVVTGNFFEDSLLKAVVLVPAFVVLSRLLEKLWTSRAILVHLAFTGACSGSTFFVAELFHVYRTHHHEDFFLPARGCMGLLVAVTVALRHAYPIEAVPLLPRAWGLQCQHLPFGLTVFFIAAGFLAPRSVPEWSFAPFSFFYAWFNIRYLMWFPNAQAHGDHSPDFCFAVLFPRPLRPVVTCLGAITYSLGLFVVPSFVRLRQVDVETGHGIVYGPAEAGRPGGDATVLGSVGGAGGAASAASDAPGSKEYNERRAKALQLLDANINSLLAPDGGAGRPMNLGSKRREGDGSLSGPEALVAQVMKNQGSPPRAEVVKAPSAPSLSSPLKPTDSAPPDLTEATSGGKEL